MSKTDHMRALREARFSRANSAPPRRASSAPATTAPMGRPARPTAPVQTLPSTREVVAQADDAEVAIAEEVIAGVEVEPSPAEALPVVAAAAVAAAFEVPTLDIPFPPSIPKMRDTPSPAARSSEPAGPPASEQIIIPALELGQLSKESPDEGSNPVAHVEGFGDIALAHHGIAPGQPIASYTGEDLATVVRWVNRDTPLPDAAAIVTAVMVELGFKRKGKKITDAITSAAVATGALTDEPVAIVAGPDAIAS